MSPQADLQHPGRAAPLFGAAPHMAPQLGPTLVIDDDTALAEDLYLHFRDAGLNPMPPCHSYEAALKRLLAERPQYCVLEIDLDMPPEAHPGYGSIGRRLLALLRSRGCRTLVYTRLTQQPLAPLRGLDPHVALLPKTAPLSAALRQISRFATS